MENLTAIFFYAIAAILIMSALFVVLSKRVVTSALWALCAFASVSGIYFMLNATFNAAAQIAVYVVAVMILIVLAIMLTPVGEDKNLWLSFKPRTFMSAGALFIFFVCLSWALVDNYLERILDILSGGISLSKNLDTVYMIGEKLMTNYVLAFEATAILLFVLVVGIGIVCILQRSEEKQ